LVGIKSFLHILGTNFDILVRTFDILTQSIVPFMKLYSIGEKIRVLRTAKGYSQTGLAKSTGLQQGQISYIETCKNKKDLDASHIEKICAALDTTLDGLEGLGTDNEHYLKAVDNLNKEETAVFNTFITDQNSMESLLQTMNIIFKINENYKKLLEDCMKKSGGGDNCFLIKHFIFHRHYEATLYS
jgi:transcriptional regulator with XRE-family HTH domain